MSNKQNQAPDIDALMERIKDVLAERGANGASAPPSSRVPQPQLMRPTVAAWTLEEGAALAFQSIECLDTKTAYQLDELLAFHDEHFVHAAYRALVRRSPDPAGFGHHLELLRQGTPKVEILGRIRYGAEGRQHNVSVQGLRRAYALQRVYRVPVFGRGLQTLAALWYLPHFERNHRAFENQIVRLIELSEAHKHDRHRSLVGAINAATAAVGELQSISVRNASALAETLSVVDSILQQKSDKSALNYLVTAVRTEEANSTEKLEKLAGQLGALSSQVHDKASGVELAALRDSLTQTRAEISSSFEELAQTVGDKGEKSIERTRADLAARIDEVSRAVEERAEMIEPGIPVTDFHAAIEQSKEALKAGLQQCRPAVRSCGEAGDHLVRKLDGQMRDLKLNVLDQERRLRLLLEEARKRLPDPIAPQQIESMLSEEDHLLDSFYVAFEDQFRGTREDIKNRVAVYLPTVRATGAGTDEAPILDLGCGRGEWLELLKEQGLAARGLDLNRVMVSQCVDAGLSVQEADAIEHLRGLPAKSLGAITGFHIIEHIPFRRLIDLFDESLRVLRPGGIIIFETPNPENLVVGACNFYYDPTHLHPLPPDMMRFVAEARGFVGAEIRRLHPVMNCPETDGNIPLIVKNRLLGEQDYSVIAYKA